MQITSGPREKKELGGNKAAGPREWRNAGLSGLFKHDKHFGCRSNVQARGVAALCDLMFKC